MSSTKNPNSKAPRYYETDQFCDLRDKWYKKLKEKGFRELEYVDPKTRKVSNSMLTVANNINGHKFNEDNYVSWSNKERYYDFARQWIWDKPVPTTGRLFWGRKVTWSKFDKFVWGMHADGVSTLDIHKRVNKKKTKHKVPKAKIEKVIKEQRELMLAFYIKKNRVDLHIVYDDDDGDPN